MEIILEPWPWYISGPLISLIMFLLLIMGKKFGMSSNLSTICTMCGADKASKFFKFDWKLERWNLIVILGVIIGGFIGSHFLSNSSSVSINPDVVENLQSMGFKSAGNSYLPKELYGATAFNEPKTLIILILGGFLVGFGSRYAGGCTSGHAISGLSDLQRASLIAVIGFFIGGLVMINFLFPQIF